MVFFDIGGVMYDDTIYARSWITRAPRRWARASPTEEFDDVYRGRARRAGGSFRRLPGAPVPGAGRRHGGAGGRGVEALGVSARGAATPTSGRASTPLAGQLPAGHHREPAERRCSDAHASATGSTGSSRSGASSDDVGLQKPDPAAVRARPVHGGRLDPRARVMVGDRLDYDVRPAKAAGMRAVWVLRGEAPDDPTPEQLAEPDARDPRTGRASGGAGDVGGAS